MTKGKVVLVPFPFDDLSATKVRPAVCLTNPGFIKQNTTIGRRALRKAERAWVKSLSV